MEVTMIHLQVTMTTANRLEVGAVQVWISEFCSFCFNGGKGSEHMGLDWFYRWNHSSRPEPVHKSAQTTEKKKSSNQKKKKKDNSSTISHFY